LSSLDERIELSGSYQYRQSMVVDRDDLSAI